MHNAFSVVSAAQGKRFPLPSGNMIITPQAISVKPARLIVMFFQYYLDIPGLAARHALHLNQTAHGQSRDLDAAARRIVSGKVLGVNLVHGLEVGHVLYE